jgi:hypothetical protein
MLFVCLSGCASTKIVALTSAIPISATPNVPLEVTTRSSGIRDPVRVPGSRVAFAGLEESLGHAVASAVAPWAESHRTERPDGWQLIAELIEAHVDRADERFEVVVGVRATLRARLGNVYLAQTQVHCKQSALVVPSQATPVFYDCLIELGHELNGWLGGVTP